MEKARRYRRLIRMLRTGKAQEIKRTMEAAKAAWVVTAGVLPGDPLKHYELALGYTSSDLEKDRATCEENKKKLDQVGSLIREFVDEEDIVQGALPTPDDTIFMKRRDEAFTHAKDIMDPQRVNWVRVDFIWY